MGSAIAVIDRSEPHYHKKATETYKVIKGRLTVFVDSRKHELNEEDVLVVRPEQIHYAVGNETWVEVVSEPGWTPEDHILVNQK